MDINNYYHLLLYKYILCSRLNILNIIVLLFKKIKINIILFIKTKY